MGLRLIGTIPPARMESQQLSPPGKLTVTMVREFFGDDPDTRPPSAPMDGVVYKGYTIERPLEGGFGKVRWKYEGGIENVEGGDGGEGAGDELDPMKEVAELQISLDQVPLGMHPNIKGIMEKFGGTMKDGELSFPRKDPTGTSKRETVDENGDPTKLNPLYGVTSYLAPRVLFRLSRIDAGGDTSRLGKIDSPPWARGLDTLSDGNNWLKTVVNTREWADRFESTEEWLYADMGWEKRIYEDV